MSSSSGFISVNAKFFVIVGDVVFVVVARGVSETNILCCFSCWKS